MKLLLGIVAGGAVAWFVFRRGEQSPSLADKLCAQAKQAGYEIPGCSVVAELAMEALDDVAETLQKGGAEGIAKAVSGAGFLSAGFGGFTHDQGSFTDAQVAEVCKRSGLGGYFYRDRCPQEAT